MRTPEEVLIETFPQWSGYITPGEMVEALDAAGYVIVPKRPTREMAAAFEDAPQTARGAMGADDIFFIRFCERYSAMIAAALSDTAQQEDE